MFASTFLIIYDGEIMKHISIFKNHNDLFQAKVSEKKQKGQGMTEYLAATALIGIAAIGTLGFMGDTIQYQFASMTAELGGQSGVKANGEAVKSATAGEKTATATSLANFSSTGADYTATPTK